MVIEVLSPSSEGDDAADKRADFQSMASLEAYPLVSQDRRSIRIYRRYDGAGRLPQPESHDGAGSFVLPRLGAPISVDEVYAGILDADGRSLLR